MVPCPRACCGCRAGRRSDSRGAGTWSCVLPGAQGTLGWWSPGERGARPEDPSQRCGWALGLTSVGRAPLSSALLPTISGAQPCPLSFHQTFCRAAPGGALGSVRPVRGHGSRGQKVPQKLQAGGSWPRLRHPSSLLPTASPALLATLLQLLKNASEVPRCHKPDKIMAELITLSLVRGGRSITKQGRISNASKATWGARRRRLMQPRPG